MTILLDFMKILFNCLQSAYCFFSIVFCHYFTILSTINKEIIIIKTTTIIIIIIIISKQNHGKLE